MKKLFSMAALAVAMTMGAHAEDNWGKMKDCAKQAEKWEAGYPDHLAPSHHYSPKYDHCYVQVYWNPFPKADFSGWMTNLDDPYEGRTIAQAYERHGEEAPSGMIWDQKTDYWTARRFIDDHMNN
jgi:hypothetical protein